MVFHFRPDGGELGFEVGDFLLHGAEVDFGLLFERVHIARHVEVEVVVGEFLRGGAVGIFLDGLEGLVGGDDFIKEIHSPSVGLPDFLQRGIVDVELNPVEGGELEVCDTEVLAVASEDARADAIQPENQR